MRLQRFKDMREDLNLSQAQLAAILNISQRTLSHYETGSRDIPIEILIKAADFFHCSTDFLLERTNKKELLK